jgi:hypothetical protein
MGTWPPIEERLWSKVDKTSSPHGCWLWTGTKVYTKGGDYGQIYYNGKLWLTHRLVYALMKGEIPEGYEVCHNCPGGDNPLCVNPEHLWTGTHRENMADRQQKGRTKGWAGVKGEARKNAKLTKEKVNEIRKLAAQGSGYDELAEIYSVHPKTIESVVKRINWKHVA